MKILESPYNFLDSKRWNECIIKLADIYELSQSAISAGVLYKDQKRLDIKNSILAPFYILNNSLFAVEVFSVLKFRVLKYDLLLDKIEYLSTVKEFYGSKVLRKRI